MCFMLVLTYHQYDLVYEDSVALLFFFLSVAPETQGEI